MHSLIFAAKKLWNFPLIIFVDEVHSPLLNGLVFLIEDPANNFRGWIHKLEKFLLQNVKQEKREQA